MGRDVSEIVQNLQVFQFFQCFLLSSPVPRDVPVSNNLIYPEAPFPVTGNMRGNMLPCPALIFHHDEKPKNTKTKFFIIRKYSTTSEKISKSCNLNIFRSDGYECKKLYPQIFNNIQIFFK